jgi:hypothetical protein
VDFPAPWTSPRRGPRETHHDPRLDSERQVIYRRFRTVASRKFADLNHDACPLAQYPRYGRGGPLPRVCLVPVPHKDLCWPGLGRRHTGVNLGVRGSSTGSVWLLRRGSCSPHQAGLVGDDDELGAVTGTEFHHGPVDMGLGGQRGNDELVGDLTVG